MDECWVPTVGNGRYEVSDRGRVRNLDGLVLRQSTAGRGYKKVSLSGRTRYVHHLVAEAFIGPRPPGMQVCHNDGVKTNNRADNLRYDTASANMADSRRHGTNNRGERNGHAKLTEDDVREIRRCYADGSSTLSELASLYGVDKMQVHRIVHRQRWAHVKKDGPRQLVGDMP